MQINSMGLCDVTPEELANILIQESPKLVGSAIRYSVFHCLCFVVFSPVIEGAQFSGGFTGDPSLIKLSRATVL